MRSILAYATCLVLRVSATIGCRGCTVSLYAIIVEPIHIFVSWVPVLAFGCACPTRCVLKPVVFAVRCVVLVGASQVLESRVERLSWSDSTHPFAIVTVLLIESYIRLPTVSSFESRKYG